MLELTEDVVIKDADAVDRALNELKDLGVRLAVDDFGTGYSSLNYLRSLPFDILKIDKTFIDDITVDPTKFAVGKLIIDLAHTLGLRTVAEGVERPEQAAALRELGCHACPGLPVLAAAPASPRSTRRSTAGTPTTSRGAGSLAARPSQNRELMRAPARGVARRTPPRRGTPRGHPLWHYLVVALAAIAVFLGIIVHEHLQAARGRGRDTLRRIRSVREPCCVRLRARGRRAWSRPPGSVRHRCPRARRTVHTGASGSTRGSWASRDP